LNNYLSFGGGVNSTALMVLLKSEGVDFEAVFVWHGGDYPETYAYINYLQSNGYKITTLSTGDIYEHYYTRKIIPTRMFRHCSDRFKVQPLTKYFKKPCVNLIGFDYGEAQRCKPNPNKKITNSFPLVDRGIDRYGCIKIIQDAGLKLPRKSGCYFCPFQRLSDIRWLRDNAPDLWCKTLRLEGNCQRKGFYLLGDKPLEILVREGQEDLWGLRKPCQCGL
jgi:hypothetical protein